MSIPLAQLRETIAAIEAHDTHTRGIVVLDPTHERSRHEVGDVHAEHVRRVLRGRQDTGVPLPRVPTEPSEQRPAGRPLTQEVRLVQRDELATLHLAPVDSTSRVPRSQVQQRHRGRLLDGLGHLVHGVGAQHQEVRPARLDLPRHLGQSLRYHLATRQRKAVVETSTDRGARFAAGTPVRLSWQPDDVWVIPE